jgi:hypothetical protein
MVQKPAPSKTEGAAPAQTMSTRDAKVMMADDISMKTRTAAEMRRLEARFKKNTEKLRRRYPEVHGKKVDWISHGHEDGCCFFNVRFIDGKDFSVMCHPEIVTDDIEFSDMKTGDERIIRKYKRPQD